MYQFYWVKWGDVVSLYFAYIIVMNLDCCDEKC